MMNQTRLDIKDEVHRLAEEAFQRHLISGYGDSEYSDEYQIVLSGKPRHLTFSHARQLLNRLLDRSS